ncbi:MAG: glycosyltransferase family 4 protein [bacterium]|nr:glycosyltransferase family 4 protein [bacterium]
MISCRLDCPGDPSSVIGENFLLEGSLFCGDDISTRCFEMGVIIQPVSADVGASPDLRILDERIADGNYYCLGEIVLQGGQKDSLGCFFQPSDDGPFKFPVAFFLAHGRNVNFAVEVGCRSLRQPHCSQTFNFMLCLRERVIEQGHLSKRSLLQCFSNSLRISILSQEEGGQAFGGFLYPQSSLVGDSFILVDGWAYRSQDTVAKVLVYLGEHCLGQAYYGAWSPFQHAVLTDGVSSAEDSARGRCRFQFVMPEPAIGSRRQRLRAEVFYRSGFRQQICGPELVSRERSAKKVLLEEMSSQPGGYLQFALRAIGPTGEEGELFLSLPGADCQLSEGSIQDGFTLIACNLSREKLSDGADVLGVWALDRSYRMKFRLPGSLMSSRAVIFFREAPTGRLVYVPLAEGIFSGTLRWACSIIYRFRLLRKLAVKRAESVLTLPGKSPVVFCLHNLTITEGAPKVAIELMLEVMRRGVFSGREVVCVSAQDGDGADLVRRAGISLHIVPELCAAGQSWDRYTAGISQLERLLPGKPALIYANVIDCFWGVDYAARRGCPSLWAIHEGESPDFYYRDLEARVRRQFFRMLKRAQHLLFVSQTSRSLFSPWVKQASQVVVRNGARLPEIDRQARSWAREELGLEDDTIVCLCLGTTCERKGQDILLSALPFVPRKVHCFIVGARPSAFFDSLKEQLERELGESILKRVEVSFVPETNDVERYFLAADLCVCPSRAEASPLVSLEAMSYGLPLLVSDIAAYREQLGSYAVYFRAGDSSSLAVELAELLADEERRGRLGREGRARVARDYSISAAYDAHIAEMLDVISGSR